jgi:hypothetical protein
LLRWKVVVKTAPCVLCNMHCTMQHGTMYATCALHRTVLHCTAQGGLTERSFRVNAHWCTLHCTLHSVQCSAVQCTVSSASQQCKSAVQVSCTAHRYGHCPLTGNLLIQFPSNQTVIQAKGSKGYMYLRNKFFGPSIHSSHCDKKINIHPSVRHILHLNMSTP